MEQTDAALGQLALDQGDLRTTVVHDEVDAVAVDLGVDELGLLGAAGHCERETVVCLGLWHHERLGVTVNDTCRERHVGDRLATNREGRGRAVGSGVDELDVGTTVDRGAIV